MASFRQLFSSESKRTRLNRVFVDFENVPSVDLSAIGPHPVEVTLLIGEKQRRLDLPLVRQIHEHAAKVTLVEVGASGRNALDMVLAWHLGKTMEQHAGDVYFVVSRDKDYDPLIRHLRTRDLDVTRVDAFHALPFVTTPAPARKPAPARRTSEPAARRAEPTRNAPEPRRDHGSPEDRFAKLVDRLQHRTKARPVRRKTLLSHINGFYGNRLSEAELEQFEERGIIKLDANGRVEYGA